jgi:hypothetical protein
LFCLIAPWEIITHKVFPQEVFTGEVIPIGGYPMGGLFYKEVSHRRFILWEVG